MSHVKSFNEMNAEQKFAYRIGYQEALHVAERERAEQLETELFEEKQVCQHTHQKRAEYAEAERDRAVEALRDALKLAEGVHGGDEMLVGEGGYYAIRDYLRGELAVLAEQEKEQPK